MRIFRTIAVTLLVGSFSLSAAAQRAALFDELAVLYPDSDTGSGVETFTSDTPRGVPAGVHVLVSGLPAGAAVRWDLRLNNLAAEVVDAYRLIDVPVEQNTGLVNRTELWDGKQNPHVIRGAPFRVFEVLEPAERTVRASDTGVLALRVEVPIAPDAVTGSRSYKLTFETDTWRQALRWELRVYPITVPPTSSLSPGYTNWFSPAIIAQRHGLELWSEPFWQMLGRYSDLMARGRQNTFLIRWRDFISVDKDEKISFDRPRLMRYVQLFLARGFTRLEGGHLAHRHQGDWNSPRLNLGLTGSDVTSKQGRAELSVILTEVRTALDEPSLRDEVQYLQHLSDEPTDINAESYRALAEQVRHHLPGVKIFEATMSLGLANAVDHWCPQVQEYQKHREFFEARKMAGDGVWIYTCLAPGGPWLNRLLDQERLRPTYLGWALANYDLNGFLHWGFNHYRSGTDPFVQSVVPHGKGPPNFLPAGDSHVVFPGKGGPLSGQRFEAQRIGMEDAELLYVLKARDARRAQAIISAAFRAFDDYETDVVAYRAAKRELLTALSPPGMGGDLALLRQTGVAADPPKAETKHRLVSALAMKLRKHVEMLSVDFHPRDHHHLENQAKCIKYISEHFKKAGGTVTTQDVEYGGKTFQNVIARFGDTGEKRFIVGAHYDTVPGSPGADDNGSAVAGLIELAHMIGQQAKNNDLKADFELVSYTLEEVGCFGSEAHAKSLKEQEVDVIGMISLEMIGYFSDEPGSQEYPLEALKVIYPNAGNFIAVIGRIDQPEFVGQFGKSMQKYKGITSLSLAAPLSMPDIGRSDHRSYWRCGWNAVMVTDTAEFRNKEYHQSGDTADRLDYEKMAHVVLGVRKVLDEMPFIQRRQQGQKP